MLMLVLIDDLLRGMSRQWWSSSVSAVRLDVVVVDPYVPCVGPCLCTDGL